jgi:bacteriorhodopsin
MIEEQLASPRPITGSHRTTTGGASRGGNLVFIIFAVVVVLLVALALIFLHMNRQRPPKAAFNAIQTAPAAVRCSAYPSPIAS